MVDTEKIILGGLGLIAVAFVLVIIGSALGLIVIAGATVTGVSFQQTDVDGSGNYIINLVVDGGLNETEGIITDEINSRVDFDEQITRTVRMRYEKIRDNCVYLASSSEPTKLNQIFPIQQYGAPIEIPFITPPGFKEAQTILNIVNCRDIGGDDAFLVDNGAAGQICFDFVEVFRIFRTTRQEQDVEVDVCFDNGTGEKCITDTGSGVGTARKAVSIAGVGRVEYVGSLEDQDICPSETQFAVADGRLVDNDKVNIAAGINNKISIRNPLVIQGVEDLVGFQIPFFNGSDANPEITNYNQAITGAGTSINLRDFDFRRQEPESTNTRIVMSGLQERFRNPELKVTLNSDFVGVRVIELTGVPSLSECRSEAPNGFVNSNPRMLFNLSNTSSGTGSFFTILSCGGGWQGGFNDFGQVSGGETVTGFLTYHPDTIASGVTCEIEACDRASGVCTTCNVTGLSAVEPPVIPTCNPPLVYNAITNECICDPSRLIVPPGNTVDLDTCTVVPITIECPIKDVGENEHIVNPDSPNCYRDCDTGFHFELDVCVADGGGGEELCPPGTTPTFVRTPIVPIPFIGSFFGETVEVECKPIGEDFTLQIIIGAIIIALIFAIALVAIFRWK